MKLGPYVSTYLREHAPSDQERWEDFYLLSPPPIAEDVERYNKIRRRLVDEGKTYDDLTRYGCR